MPSKSTHRNFTSVNFIPTSNTQKTHFLTTDRLGNFSIYEKTAAGSKAQKSLPFKFQKHASSSQSLKNLSFAGPGPQTSTAVSSSSAASSSTAQRIVKVFDNEVGNSRRGQSKNGEADKVMASTVIDSESVILCEEDKLRIYKLNYKSSSNSFEPESFAKVPVETEGRILCISRDRNSFNKSYLADDKGNIFVFDIKTSKISRFHTNSFPVSSVVSLNDGNETLFATSDYGGNLVMFDSRCKHQILKHKCAAASSLLSLTKTNYAYNSQEILACGAENGLIYLYDIKAQKACKSPIYDRKEPYPVYDLCFNQNRPDTLYSASVHNVAEIKTNREDENGQKIWFQPCDLNKSDSSEQSVNLSNTLSTTRSTIHSLDHASFVSLDCDNRNNMVAVSQNGVIYCW